MEESCDWRGLETRSQGQVSRPSAHIPAGGCRKQLASVIRIDGLGNSMLDSWGKRKLTSHSEVIKAWLTGQLGIGSVAYAVTRAVMFYGWGRVQQDPLALRILT